DELANALGCHQSTVAKWELNERQPHGLNKILDHLVDLLGFPKDFYFGNENATDAQPGAKIHKKGLPRSTGEAAENGENPANLNPSFINGASGSTGEHVEGDRDIMNSPRARFALQCLEGLGPDMAMRVFDEYLRRVEAQKRSTENPQ